VLYPLPGRIPNVSHTRELKAYLPAFLCMRFEIVGKNQCLLNITKSYSNSSISRNAEVITLLISELPVGLFAAIDKVGCCLGTAKQRKAHFLHKRISEIQELFFC